MQRQVTVRAMLKLTLFVALAAAVCVSCHPASQTTGVGQGAAKTKKTSKAHPSGPASLFDGTKVADVAPDSLDVTHDGKWVIAKFREPANWKTKDPAGRSYLAASFALGPSGLGETQGLFVGADLIRAFIGAAPSGAECLLVTNTQQPGGPVVDMLWRAQKNSRSGVIYEQAPGFPTSGPQDMRFGLNPFYSWDGTQVIVPLNGKGLVVTTIRDQQSKFIAYPDYPKQITGSAFGALPDAEGRHRIYASFWSASVDPELCRVHVLDLDNMKWSATVELDWVVYQVASADADNLPWLVRGSRAPRTNVEHTRVPRLALIDPLSGAVDFKEFLGEPVWETALDPTGKYVAYMDGMRKALVRLDVEAGELDIDPAFFDGEAKLFVSAGGDTVLAWNKKMLYRANFTKHEKPNVSQGK
jgi:hypothetical protein